MNGRNPGEQTANTPGSRPERSIQEITRRNTTPSCLNDLRTHWQATLAIEAVYSYPPAMDPKIEKG
jgi:hypothetical protein